MSRKVYGTLRNVGDQAQRLDGIRVQAWDDDYPDGDDFMGESTTDVAGGYVMTYEDGHWDPSISHKITVWRPDIYVTADVRSAAGHWVRVAKSGVKQDHKLRDDLRIDLDVNLEAPVSATTRFDPARHGFRFPNSFEVDVAALGIDVGSWNMGLCGGICAAALYRFARDMPVPTVTETPMRDTDLYDELLRRQIASLPTNVLAEIFDWQSAPDQGHWYRKHSVGHRTHAQWWALKARLDAGRPTSLVLIRVEGYFSNPTDNHQVVATGYTYNPTTKDVKISIYDPNVIVGGVPLISKLIMNMGLPDSNLDARDSSGKRLRGFFVNPAGDVASETDQPVMRPGVVTRVDTIAQVTLHESTEPRTTQTRPGVPARHEL